MKDFLISVNCEVGNVPVVSLTLEDGTQLKNIAHMSAVDYLIPLMLGYNLELRQEYDEDCEDFGMVVNLLRPTIPIEPVVLVDRAHSTIVWRGEITDFYSIDYLTESAADIRRGIIDRFEYLQSVIEIALPARQESAGLENFS